MRALSFALAFALVACGTPIRLPEKTTPARTRISMKFETDPALVAMVAPAAEAIPGETPEAAQARAFMEQQAAAQRQMLAETGVRLEAALREGLLKHRVGLPAPADAADVHLVGRIAVSPTGGIEASWQLVEPATGATVAAGVARDVYFRGYLGLLRDQVLAGLLGVDIDSFSHGAPVVTVGPPLDAAPASKTDGRNAWAVVVGVERYRESLPEATHAEADARTFALYAQRTLGLPADHVKVLVGDRAGLADIRSAVEEWLPRNAVTAGGRVYFFFSGHGAPDPETGAGYLVPFDADPAYLKTRGLAVEELYAKLGALSGQQSVVVLDACFSGGGARSVLAKGTRPLVPVRPSAAPAGVVALAAAGPKETTGAAREASHGLFSWYLLRGLGGEADADADGHVTLAELAGFVQTGVTTDARLDNREQTPTLSAPPGFDPAALRLVEGLQGRR
jgi:hypothetical protein